uniref:DUF295 domain-containing protein n=1 Tax=Setaria viridis TaxID=4556 RepID=A0A4U6VKN4_SETVI|nr:hypothetical protein SEVIR_3G403500v2 [Setaria viridis]
MRIGRRLPAVLPIPASRRKGGSVREQARHRRATPAGRMRRHLLATGGERRRLPRPFIRVDAQRRFPSYFATVGTRIVATIVSVPDVFQPIVNVRSRGVTFGPGLLCPFLPIYLPVGDDEVFALDTSSSFAVLSLAKLWPPRLENQCHRDISEWSWLTLPPPPFDRLDVTSYAVHPDERWTILVSTAAATFAFDATARVWARRGEWALPFAGRAHFVHGLNAIVGLSKDPASLGHLCSCKAAATGDGWPTWKLGREKLFSEDPAERHVGATLLYLGGSEFCLVRSVSIGGGNNTADEEELEEEGDGGADEERETFRVQCYKVPEGTTEASILADPVAFWL